jgi:hypothetical protein
MSHDAAALELGLPILQASPELVHVTRPHVTGSRTEFGVKHHGAVFHPDQVVQIGGIDVLGPARTAVDIAREHGIVAGTVACDSAMRLGVRRPELVLAYEPMRYWPGVTCARAAVELADPRAESVGETLLRLLVVELGIGDVETQFEIRDGNRTARCDLRVGRHVFEFDGRIKYRRRADGGLAAASPEQVVWEEKRRQDWVCGYGLGMSRVIWPELWEPLRSRTKERLLREFRATCSRFGTELSGLTDLIVVRRAS